VFLTKISYRKKSQILIRIFPIGIFPIGIPIGKIPIGKIPVGIPIRILKSSPKLL
jgi:hypothetical protein